MTMTCRFDGNLEAVAAARAWLATQLRHLAPSGLVNDAQLCLSELASNAVNHSGSDFEVSVEERDGCVRITVSDSSDDQPVVRASEPHHQAGRGLLIVDAIAERWGVTLHPPAGKSVWCELAVAAAP